MAALLAVLLAGVATALAANRFALRRIDTVAVLRCLRAPTRHPRDAVRATPAAGGAGLRARHRLGHGRAAGLVAAPAASPDRLPLPQAWPALSGAGIGLVLLLGFGLPPLLRLRDVPPMRVLNRSFSALPPTSLLAYAAALAATAALTLLATGDTPRWPAGCWADWQRWRWWPLP
jgi:putative ABC transport system permease protein